MIFAFPLPHYHLVKLLHNLAQCPNSGLVPEFEIIIYDNVLLERFDGLTTGQ